MDSWWMPLAAGLQDGLNPCLLLLCAAFIIYMVMVGDSPKKNLLLIVFALVSYSVLFALNTGVLFVWFFSAGTQVVLKYLILFFAACAIAAGYFWGRDWLVLQGMLKSGKLWQERLKSPRGFGSQAVWGLLLAIFFSALAAAMWPMHYYMGVLASSLLAPGQWLLVLPAFFLYTAALMWPLFLLWYLTASKKVSPSLRTVISSAIFITAGFGILFIF